MSRLVIKAIDKDAPGFLRHLRQISAFQQGLVKGDYKPEDVDGVIQTVLDFVVEPTDRREAAGMLVELSGAQFNDLLRQITRGGGGDGDDPLAQTSASQPGPGTGE